jgi:2'-5' RNA ligase
MSINGVAVLAQRLAQYHVTLYCPADLAEEQLDQLCEALEVLDFRSKIQAWLEWYTRNRRVLREVTVTVDE